MRGRRRRAAFTLVEALAALTLAAIVLPVVMRGISLGLAAAGESKRQTEAVTLAEAKLNELVADGSWQSTALTGDFGTDWPDYGWTATVADWQGPTLRQLAVSVEWTAREKKRAVTLTTLVYTGTQ